MPYLNTLSAFRDNVRKLAIGKGDTALKDILALSDSLRDVDLVPLGVALDDQEGIGQYETPNCIDQSIFCRWQSTREVGLSGRIDEGKEREKSSCGGKGRQEAGTGRGGPTKAYPKTREGACTAAGDVQAS